MSLRLVRRGPYWYVRGTVRLPGRDRSTAVYESAGTGDRRQAEQYRDTLLRRLIDDDALGDYALTFAECAVVYLSRGGEKRFLRPILERFGECRLRDIRPADVANFAAERYGRLAPSSLKRFFYTPLNAALRAGCEAHNLPAVHFQPPRLPPREAVEHAPDAWFPQFFAAANFRIAAMVLFLTTTGTRVSEACRLTVGDCTLTGERPAAKLRRTKSGKPRVVPLTGALVRAMEGLVAQGGLTAGDRVFGYASRWSVNQAIERVCQRAGLPYYSSHKLGRHAFAARLLAKGGTLKEVMEAGGWASINMVSDVYGHLEQRAIDAAVLEAAQGISPSEIGAKSVQSPKGEKTLRRQTGKKP